jgi:hypothetical protein
MELEYGIFHWKMWFHTATPWMELLELENDTYVHA